MNPPDDKEFGVLIGEVRAMRQQVADSQRSTREQISDLQRISTTEHAANAERMERIEAKLTARLDEKADAKTVGRLAKKVEDLSLTDAGTRARDNILKGGFGALIALATLFAIIIGDHIHL